MKFCKNCGARESSGECTCYEFEPEEVIIKFCDAWKLFGTKHDWFNCRKKPVIIKAIQMDKDFKVKTPEGIVVGKAGDYLLQGIRQEVYPCRKDIFEESYNKVK